MELLSRLGRIKAQGDDDDDDDRNKKHLLRRKINKLKIAMIKLGQSSQSNEGRRARVRERSHINYPHSLHKI